MMKNALEDEVTGRDGKDDAIVRDDEQSSHLVRHGLYLLQIEEDGLGQVGGVRHDRVGELQQNVRPRHGLYLLQIEEDGLGQYFSKTFDLRLMMKKMMR